MIIRTNMATRRSGGQTVRPPQLSSREQKRLENTKHATAPAVVNAVSIQEEVVVEPVKEEILPVREEIIEKEKEIESAAVEETIEERDEAIAEPGTAVVRSKVFDELQNKPKKKYKVVSLGK